MPRHATEIIMISGFSALVWFGHSDFDSSFPPPDCRTALSPSLGPVSKSRSRVCSFNDSDSWIPPHLYNSYKWQMKPNSLNYQQRCTPSHPRGDHMQMQNHATCGFQPGNHNVQISQMQTRLPKSVHCLNLIQYQYLASFFLKHYESKMSLVCSPGAGFWKAGLM